MNIKERYIKIIEEVKSTAERCGRTHSDIRIIAVSKTVAPEIVQLAIDSGIHLFGENRVQEAKAKIPQLTGNFTFHMIGHLQSNKAADAINLFDMIHSIDKISTAQTLNEAARRINKVQKILIQIKTSDEVTKSGISPEDSFSLTENILRLGNLKLHGLMTIGPVTSDRNITRQAFRQTASTLDILNNRFGLDMKEISMGMSGDFNIAVEEGATLLRVGSSIFGTRLT